MQNAEWDATLLSPKRVELLLLMVGRTRSNVVADITRLKKAGLIKLEKSGRGKVPTYIPSKIVILL